MDSYHIWCNIKESHRDLDFARDVCAYLGYLRQEGLIEGYRLTRRKLGFSPDGMGEFHITIEVRSLTQLENAFQQVAARSGELERLHRSVYSAVCDARFALYRDFPDPVRSAESSTSPNASLVDPPDDGVF